jgi:hypothetical protein
MVSSRGASDDACLDTNNQALPPRGDESTKKHENANRIACTLNLNSISSEISHLAPAKVNIQSTARDLPKIDLTNLSELSAVSVNSKLSSQGDASNDNVRAQDAFKNLLQTASALQTDGNIGTALPPADGTPGKTLVNADNSESQAAKAQNHSSPFAIHAGVLEVEAPPATAT